MCSTSHYSGHSLLYYISPDGAWYTNVGIGKVVIFAVALSVYRGLSNLDITVRKLVINQDEKYQKEINKKKKSQKLVFADRG